MAQIQAEQPTTTYKEFKQELLNEIARCLNMPLNIALCNSSQYNYSSGRLDHQTYYKAIRVDQSHLERVVLDRLLAAWLDEATLVPDLLPSGLGPFAQWPHQWFWDGHEHVDPAKEANAQATRLESHTTTLADEYAKRGQDWEVQLRQRAKEVALMSQLGLTIGQVSPAPSQDYSDVQDEEVPADDA
jgi:capsid protein